MNPLRILHAAAALLALLGLATGAPARPETGADRLRVGHWLEVKGALVDAGRFDADEAELVQPQDTEELLGTVPEGQGDLERFTLLGQPVEVSSRTDWKDMRPAPLGGERVKVEGHWRGPRRFAARDISRRGAGRDRILGRIDAIEVVGDELVVTIMSWRVGLARDFEIDHEEPFEAYALGPPLRQEVAAGRDEDDLLGSGVRLADGLTLSGQLELRYRNEAEYDLLDIDHRDRRDHQGTARLRLTWDALDDVTGVLELRHNELLRDDERDGWVSTSSTRLGETYLALRSPFDLGLDLQVGRQDFDDEREWLYDQNLDAVRVSWTRPDLRLELSASTTLSDGSPYDEAATNWILYASNNDTRRHLGAYVIHRDVDLGAGTRTTHLGARAIGEFLPDAEVWAELGGVTGTEGDTDLAGWAWDLGAVWSPGWTPLRFALGAAVGSGDDDDKDGTDHAYRQTGLQDNTAKLGGVTSIRYYGEVLDPELSNLAVLTGAVVLPLSRRESLSLVWHKYDQVRAADFLRDAALDMDPGGASTDIGWGLDLVLGSRRFASWDIEVIGGYFNPGGAFGDADSAGLFQIQARYRF